MGMSITSFVHRTVFDYLHTSEMQLLLGRYTPIHFKEALFSTKLNLAACKMVVLDPDYTVADLCDASPKAGWFQLHACVADLLFECDPEVANTDVSRFHEALMLVKLLE
jgi:hypothetical protein